MFFTDFRWVLPSVENSRILITASILILASTIRTILYFTLNHEVSSYPFRLLSQNLHHVRPAKDFVPMTTRRGLTSRQVWRWKDRRTVSPSTSRPTPPGWPTRVSGQTPPPRSSTRSDSASAAPWHWPATTASETTAWGEMATAGRMTGATCPRIFRVLGIIGVIFPKLIKKNWN